jgi:hypothetical protein
VLAAHGDRRLRGPASAPLRKYESPLIPSAYFALRGVMRSFRVG